MHSSISIAYLFILVLLPLVSYGKPLYIDASCTAKEGWAEYWHEGQSMAKRAIARMDSESDTDFRGVMMTIFKADKNSKEGKYVRSGYPAYTLARI